MTDGQPANISYSLRENEGAEMDACILSYDEILNDVTTSAEAIPDPESESDYEYDYSNDAMAGMDDYIASELDYQTNYIKKELERIADYYELSKRKKRKDELIEDIVIYEKDPVNVEKVYQRKKMWRYIEEIKKDKYLRQFLILD
tara:strand:+ start:80 stop:514 length:435 start_codon:yes stop_codon:yes gene_type:complete